MTGNCTHDWTATSPCPFCQQEEVKRLRGELACAESFHRVAVKQRDAAWGEIIRLKRILREYATRVPIAYKEGHAELMRETWEILDSDPSN